MARKGDIEVDIKKENPLLTILKAGKVPVIRLADKGFQNYKQEKYFNYYDGGSHKTQTYSNSGCFVAIGGVQGSYVCGGHYGEQIHIGYLEPDEQVFITHNLVPNGKLYTCQTAKERLEDTQKSFEIFVKGAEKKNWDWDDFDLYSEAIVDSKKIRKALVINPNEYQFMLPYCGDGLFKIFKPEIIFYHICWKQSLAKEFVSHMHWTVKDCHHYYYGETEVYSLMESKFYKNLILKELVHFYTNGSFINDSDYYDRLQKAMIDYQSAVKGYLPAHYDADTVFRNLYDTHIAFRYETNDSIRYGRTISINTYTNQEKVEVCISQYKGYSSNREYKNYTFTDKNILSQEYRHHLYKIIEMKNFFLQYLGEFIPATFPKWMSILEAFKKTEDNIFEWTNAISYTYDEKNHELLFEKDDLKFLYNLILLDGVVEVNTDDDTHYYNLDNLPENFDRFWLDIILETLSPWRVSFFIKMLAMSEIVC